MTSAPYSETGLTVAVDIVLGQSATAAFFLRTAIAYTTGIRLTIETYARSPMSAGEWDETISGTAPGSPLFGCGFTDDPATVQLAPLLTPIGSRQTNVSIRHASGGSGDESLYRIHLWCSPSSEGIPFVLAGTWPHQAVKPWIEELVVPSTAEILANAPSLWNID
jgi:hypothetical protein